MDNKQKKGELIATLKFWFGAERTPNIFNDLDFIIERQDDFIYIWERVE